VIASQAVNDLLVTMCFVTFVAVAVGYYRDHRR
jgi:hypothetical protein